MFETPVTLAMIKESVKENKTRKKRKPTQAPRGSRDICQSVHLWHWKKDFGLTWFWLSKIKLQKHKYCYLSGLDLKQKFKCTWDLVVSRLGFTYYTRIVLVPWEFITLRNNQEPRICSENLGNWQIKLVKYNSCTISKLLVTMPFSLNFTKRDPSVKTNIEAQNAGISMQQITKAIWMQGKFSFTIRLLIWYSIQIYQMNSDKIGASDVAFIFFYSNPFSMITHAFKWTSYRNSQQTFLFSSGCGKLPDRLLHLNFAMLAFQ